MKTLMRDYRIWLAIGGLLLAGKLIYPALAGDRYQVREQDHQNFVFVDKESGDTFILRVKNPIETNPVTGRQTLAPGLYCPQCQKWRASPPMEVLQQNPSASICPTHKIPMSGDGPVPTNLK